MIPPRTTVAKGRCTPAPAPLASAIGKHPKLATVAVISGALCDMQLLTQPASSREWHPARNREIILPG